MQNIENAFEINLSHASDSKEVVNGVVAALDVPERRNGNIKITLGSVEINQSQMVFIKSLVESFGYDLVSVEAENQLTKDACAQIGLGALPYSGAYLNDVELDDLREEFKAGFENVRVEERPAENSGMQEETVVEEKIEQEAPVQENNEQENFEVQEENFENQQTDETLEQGQNKLVEVIKEDITEEDAEAEKRTIGVYRKADEKENEIEFKDEDVDFYAVPTNETVVADANNTIYVNQTLRNGQILDYDGNVVIIGDCHPGSEIKATGDITVWGVLGSIAHAGIKGNKEARIRALKMNAVQLRIADCYSRRPDGGNIPYIVKSSSFTPEEARIVDDNIVLFKLAQE